MFGCMYIQTQYLCMYEAWLSVFSLGEGDGGMGWREVVFDLDFCADG